VLPGQDRVHPLAVGLAHAATAGREVEAHFRPKGGHGPTRRHAGFIEARKPDDGVESAIQQDAIEHCH
jgi:hypothetical protein